MSTSTPDDAATPSGRPDAAPAARSTYEHTCRHDADDGRAIRSVLDRVGDKWSLLVIGTLQHGALRFTELQRHVPGVSQRMLTLTLRHLERDGMVTRTVHAEVPPRVEYELTPMGRTLIEPSDALASWAIAHREAIEAAQAAFDART